jgi:RNA polymerase-binding transcription factor DksA
MNIELSNPAFTKRISSARKSRFPEEDAAKRDSSLSDWRPGRAARQDKGHAKVLDIFIRGQREKLLQLRKELLSSMKKVAEDTRMNPTDGSALATHSGDAGSDAYDRDFAHCLLFQDQNALIEIEHALRRIESRTYGICEMSGEPIPISRLEAIPFARFTVECQAEVEKQQKRIRGWEPICSLSSRTHQEDDPEEERSSSKSYGRDLFETPNFERNS